MTEPTQEERVLAELAQAESDEAKLAIEAAAIKPTDNSARDGDHEKQEVPK